MVSRPRGRGCAPAMTARRTTHREGGRSRWDMADWIQSSTLFEVYDRSRRRVREARRCATSRPYVGPRCLRAVIGEPTADAR
jgi:hypothetical protein